MHTGSELLQTWIPDGGFKIERRKLKTPDGGSALAECLPEPEAILALAGRYGLFTVSIPRLPGPGQVIRAAALPPEPIEIWRREMQALRACTELWDAITTHKEPGAREGLGRPPYWLDWAM